MEKYNKRAGRRRILRGEVRRDEGQGRCKDRSNRGVGELKVRKQEMGKWKR